MEEFERELFELNNPGEMDTYKAVMEEAAGGLEIIVEDETLF